MSPFLLYATIFVHLSHARIGLIVSNTFESHQLTCPEDSFFPCVEGVFTQTNAFDVANHRIYEGYINCTSAQVSITTSGLATVNTALTTQLLIDHYRYDKDPIDFIITYGMAGGMDNRLNVGDVVVATKWSLYNLWSWQNVEHDDDDMLPLEDIGDYTRSYGYWQSDKYHKVWFQPQQLFNETVEQPVHTMYFYADTDALQIMRNISDEIENKLHKCSTDLVDGSQQCLGYSPQIITEIDGMEAVGITADIFVDNLEWRQTLFDQFGAQSLDMETAAVAMVAQTNNIPFIAFRSLSDLAGAKEANSSNVIDIFLDVAVQNSVTVLTEWIYTAYCDDEAFVTKKRRKKQKRNANLYIVVPIICIAFVICCLLAVWWYNRHSNKGNTGHVVINNDMESDALVDR